MQKHLIVVAHPVEDSFTMSLTRAYVGELIRAGHDVRVHDLYRMGFDPVLSARELIDGNDVHIRMVDVLVAQEDVLAADVVTAIYPLWWMSMPAMMKGYIDRVFSRGFAYEAEQGKVRGLLSGRRAAVVTVSGAPLAALVQDGRWQAMELLQDTHIFRAAGFELVGHLHIDEVGPALAPSTAAADLARVREFVRGHFASVHAA
ncbi:FMN-dependent NADH-azoreductase [Paraburkholderia caffeinitolerans]|uniref:FMN-dependent NADH-azoreductase n=1 Tax=Paraburkholderia caffeinitolerans TaxID=1723730 RepID=A0A6J5FWV5_9BURK|nr:MULTISPECIES: NAD(P)H-dependent oxidoreductase [Paraburkholderia]CAB3788970.1 FMN-dependent NADH-azoreductase [Paraburkholderia caffeinitolerans]